jgi:hypothetical protein
MKLLNHFYLWQVKQLAVSSCEPYTLEFYYQKERLGADYEGKITTYTGRSQRYLQFGM